MAVTDLIEDWSESSPLPPFERISEEDFIPAFKIAFESARSKISDIADCAHEPTFENVIDAFEFATEILDRVECTFSVLVMTESNDRLRAIELEIVQQKARFEAETWMNQKLFARFEFLWNRRDQLGLSGEQMTVLRKRYRSFVKSGVQLKAAERQRFAEIKERLAVLSAKFSQNVLADESAWYMTISGEDLAALPEFLRTAAGQAASQRGIKGHIITLDRSLIEPFLKFSENRSLRESAYRAWSGRCANGGETDNREIVKEIVGLRHELADLLGSPTYARHILADEMAKTPEAVRGLLQAVWGPAKIAAESDQRDFQAALNADGHDGRIEPWDWRYYAECRRKAEYDLDEVEIKRHFQLDRIADAAFDVARKLFGLEFHELEVAAHNADCRAWSVSRDNQHVGTFVADYFTRPSKTSGAWCMPLLQQTKLGKTLRPVVLNVCNFIRPADGEPCLLSYDDAKTLFHEFGHALHNLLSDVTYPSVSGLEVVRDFVELPSQLLENWLDTDWVLDNFAIDPETGSSLPPDLRAKMAAARNVDQPFSTMEYLACALVDLGFHEGKLPDDPIEFQDHMLSEWGMPHGIGMRHATPHFQHIFADDDGYASKYYSYLWSDVLVADTYGAFLENGGPYCRETAARLEQNILSKGGSLEAQELYLAFRERLPEPDALLKKRGFAAPQ